MARRTKAQQQHDELEHQALAFFKRALSELPDPRRAQGVRYPLPSVVVIALMAMVCGADDAEAMQLWGEANEPWLASVLALPHGVPTQDVFLSVFAALNPEAFGELFRAWMAWLDMQLSGQDKHIAIDGKSSRRSFDTSQQQPALHTVSAWMSEAGLVLGQCKTEDKSNEIEAIPRLLRRLDLRGATVTIDAIGCQTAIAEAIVEAEADYLLAVKDNQPTLRHDIEKTFGQAADDRRRSVDELERPKVDVFETVDKAHGRVDKRTVSMSRDLQWLTTEQDWRGLSFVVQVKRERTVLSTHTTSVETAYYIGSDSCVAVDKVAAAIRRHWGIENELHWVLDMAFREDEARHRAGNTAQNMTMLRHFALNLIKQDHSRKLGVANSRKRAAWDHSYLLKLLTSADD